MKREFENDDEIHPIYYVFNHIFDPYTFQRCSLVCKSWKKILDEHPFWRKVVEDCGLESPRPNSRKYKTYKSIFVKNFNKLCPCYKGLLKEHDFVYAVNFKLRILREYCYYKLRYKVYKDNYVYRNLVNFVLEKILKLIEKSDMSTHCIYLLGYVRDLINQIYKKHDRIEKYKEICEFVKVDFIKVVVRNLYRIINDKTLYIEKFGGYVKDWHYKIDNKAEYKDL
ncbi:13865_t:CDS:1 [Dentiscutata erythropus]|uniref:13865_t:CDS:1 n=1 Tax=Dentiscutata erythropus TaxID=1348616 RepID=A0A9N9NBX1_9GLOM|nr:13865_t:CDS:1 [Dentiscutata erythropus]